MNQIIGRLRPRRIIPEWIFAMLIPPFNHMSLFRVLTSAMVSTAQKTTEAIAASLVKQYIDLPRTIPEEIDKSLDELKAETDNLNFLFQFHMKYWSDSIVCYTSKLDQQNDDLLLQMQNLSQRSEPSPTDDDGYSPDIVQED